MAAAWLFFASPAAADGDWGSIDITTNINGQLVVTLESDQIKVVYKQSTNDFAVAANGRPTCIDEFWVKEWDKDFTDGGRFDNHLKQRLMTSAEVIYDGPDRKTVYMTWESGARQEVSMFPDSRFLQIDYLDWDFLITDWPDWPKDELAWMEQRVAVHGEDQWHRTIDPADQPTHPDGWPWDPNDPTHFPNDPNAMREWGYEYDEVFYNRIPRDAEKQGELDPEDGGPLNYNGHFIMGSYKLETGQGIGRVVPVDRTRAIILWNYRAWEFVPTGRGRITSYLYPVTKGRSEILALGKSVVDTGIVPNAFDDPPNPDDDIYFLLPGETLTISALDGVLVNDSDPEGDPITAELVNAPSQGQVTLNPDGSFVYIHDGTEFLADSFTYQAVDSAGNVATPTTVTLSPADQRVNPGLVVLYRFNEGGGDTVHDVSGTGIPLDLTVSDPAAVTWLPDGGLSVDSATTIISPGPATKVIDQGLSTNELTVEAWVRSSDLTQFGTARIFALSLDGFPNGGNFILGQGTSPTSTTDFDMRLRTTSTSRYGTPSLSTPDGIVDNALHHVVYTREDIGATGISVLYVDGVPVADGLIEGDFSSWATDAILVLGNEPSGDRPWLGEFHLAAVYNRALTHAEVTQNFVVGPEVDRTLPTDFTDPGFSLQWGLDNSGQTGGTPDADIDLPEALALQSQIYPVVVAVLDTGVDYSHEDLAQHMWVNTAEIPGNSLDDDGNGYVDDYLGWDFFNADNDPMDDNGHGTHVAGIISGVSGNGFGGVGVSQMVKLMPLKFQDPDNVGTIAAAVEAIEYATMMGADIISSSWLMSAAWPEGPGFSQELKDAIAAANDAGVLFVATVGNSSLDLDQMPMYPAAYDNPNIITVASTDHNDVMAPSSNYGVQSVDIAAPGVDIYSTVPTGPCTYCDPSGYATLSGTSFATPHVTGVAALVKSQYPALSHFQIKAILMNSSDYLPTLDGKTVSEGRVNAFNALQLAASMSPDAPAIIPPANQEIDEDTTTGALTFTIFGSDVESISVTTAFDNSAAVADVAVNGTGSTRTVTVTPVPEASGDSLITLTASDGSMATDASFMVTISPVNDVPTVSAPGAATTGPNEPVTLVGTSVADIDTAVITLGLTVTRGTLTVADSVVGGVTAGDITGNGTNSVTLSAPIDWINVTLGSPGGLIYTGLPNLVGMDTLIVAADDGETSGSGATVQTIDSAAITVQGADWYTFLSERFAESVLTDLASESSHWGPDADFDGNGIRLIDEYLYGGDDPDSANTNKARLIIREIVPEADGMHSYIFSHVLSARAIGEATVTLRTRTDLNVPQGPAGWNAVGTITLATEAGRIPGTSELTVQSTDLYPDGEGVRLFHVEVDLGL